MSTTLLQAKEALKFYADPSRYEGPNQRILAGDDYTPIGMEYRLDVSRDQGEIARTALAALSAVPQEPEPWGWGIEYEITYNGNAFQRKEAFFNKPAAIRVAKAQNVFPIALYAAPVQPAQAELEPVLCKLRLFAYYYGFEQTGVPAIDRILSAVAWAGKAYHNTEDWQEECHEREECKGKSPVEWIQNAANDAAKLLAAPVLPEAEKTAKQIHQMINDACHSDPIMINGDYCLTLHEVRTLLEMQNHSVHSDKPLAEPPVQTVQGGAVPNQEPSQPDNLAAKLHSTMDAQVWAKEFCRLNSASDESTMLGWFANAIMVGHDFAMRKAEAGTAPPNTTGLAKCEKEEFDVALTKLGARLALMLDDDQFNNIEPMLSKLAALAHPTPDSQQEGKPPYTATLTAHSSSSAVFTKLDQPSIVDSGSKPNIDCSGDPTSCPNNEGYGCDCSPSIVESGASKAVVAYGAFIGTTCVYSNPLKSMVDAYTCGETNYKVDALCRREETKT